MRATRDLLLGVRSQPSCVPGQGERSLQGGRREDERRARAVLAEGYGAYFAAQARFGTQLLKQIIAVEPPASLQPLVLNALRPQGKVVGIVIALRNQVGKGADPLKAYNAVSATLKRLTSQADAAWRRAGLNACAG